MTITPVDSSTGNNCAGSHTRTWTATDVCGNSASASQTFTFQDNEAPQGFAPADTTIECNSTLPTDTPTFMDNCDADLTYEYIDSPFSGGCLGSLFRTWTISDDCGNTITADQIILLIDEIAPELFNVPADITIECDEELPAVPTDIFATDNCGNEVVITLEEVIQGTDCPYVLTCTWTAVDQCNNETVLTQVINVVTTVDTDELLLALAPNPIDDEGLVTFVVPEDGYVTLEVVNNVGQTISYIYRGYALGGREYRIRLGANQFNAGIYTTRLIFNNEKIARQQFIKLN